MSGATQNIDPAKAEGTPWTIGALYGLGFINTIEIEEQDDEQ